MKAPRVPTCRVCGCTDMHACEGGGCWWVKTEGPPLCSACSGTAGDLAEVQARIVQILKPRNVDFKRRSQAAFIARKAIERFKRREKGIPALAT